MNSYQVFCLHKCDHGSECLLLANHGVRHESQHGCVFYGAKTEQSHDLRWLCLKCGYTEGFHKNDNPKEIRACPFCSGQRRAVTIKECARFEQSVASGLPFIFDKPGHAPGEE